MHQKGLTTTELIIAVALGAVVTLGVATFANDTVRFQDEFQGRFQMLDDVRRVIRPMVDEIRQVQDSSVGDYAIDEVSSTTLTIFSDVIDNGYRERIRYFVEGGQLKRGVIVPDGVPLSYDAGDEEVNILMDNVTELAFRYYDQSFTGTESALLHPFPVSDVRLIEVQVTVDDDANRAPNPLGQVSMYAQLRNLKNDE